MTKASIENLEEQIGRLVREHVEACRTAAAAALERAFAAAVMAQPTQGREKSPKPRRGPGRRRAREEVLALSEKLYTAICANPGATMTVLAPKVGATARELNRPATLLRQAGRARSAGRRHATRYFPVVAKTAA